MSKLAFPSITVRGFRGFISQVRTQFQMMASWVEKNDPSAAAELNAQMQTLAAATGFVQNQPGTKLLISSGVKVTGPAITGSYVNGYTFTIANGVITGIVAS